MGMDESWTCFDWLRGDGARESRCRPIERRAGLFLKLLGIDIMVLLPGKGLRFLKYQLQKWNKS